MLPAWEFSSLVHDAFRLEARQNLDTYHAVSMAAWGDKEGRENYVKNMSRRAGDDSDERSAKLPTAEELDALAKSLFPEMPDVEDLIRRKEARANC